MLNTHDFRVLAERPAPICGACYGSPDQVSREICPGSVALHVPANGGSLCGSPGGVSFDRPSCPACIAIVDAAPAVPEHDFREGTGNVACARCGKADYDILTFGICSPRPDFGGVAYHTHARSGDGPLCGAAERRPLFASGRWPATCPACFAAIRDLPPLDRPHDFRLGGGDAIVCAACGFAETPSGGLRFPCDGGAFADAPKPQRTAAGETLHLRGCRFWSARTDGGNGLRVTCRYCLRRLRSAPIVRTEP